MNKFLKKNWFVVLLTIAFTAIITFYIYDTNKGKLKGKEVTGESVVYEINKEDTTASQFYDELYSSKGTDNLITLFKKAVADASVSTTSEIKDTASARAESIRSSYQSSYGANYESYLNGDLQSTGYSDLEEYLIEQQKLNQVSAEYAKANFDDLKIRQISYILIKFDDVSKPTSEPSEAEKAKMDKVDSALSSGTTFADVAADNSEDPSTANNGGDLGVIDKNSATLDASFLDASLALKEGEVSDWIRSDSFGYFKIMCTASTPETLEKNNADTDPYLALVQNYDSTLENKAVWEKASSLGIDYKGNKDVEKTIKDYFDVNDSDKEKDSDKKADKEPESKEESSDENKESN